VSTVKASVIEGEICLLGGAGDTAGDAPCAALYAGGSCVYKLEAVEGGFGLLEV